MLLRTDLLPHWLDGNNINFVLIPLHKASHGVVLHTVGISVLCVEIQDIMEFSSKVSSFLLSVVQAVRDAGTIHRPYSVLIGEESVEGGKGISGRSRTVQTHERRS